MMISVNYLIHLLIKFQIIKKNIRAAGDFRDLEMIN